MTDEFKGKNVRDMLEKVRQSDIMNDKFLPSTKMYMAKRRLWDALEYNPVRVTEVRDIALEEIAAMAGIPTQFFVLAEKHPTFIAWMCDKDYENKKIQAAADKAFEVLVKIAHSPIEPKVLTAKDKVAAVQLILQLGDRFPNKRREFVYVDKELAKMTEADVDRETSKLDKLLTPGKQPLDNEE